MKTRPAAEKITTFETILSLLRPPRTNQTLVLANGVFDLFHVGHLRYLEGAAEHGDLLIVAVNSDVSTRRYKGPGRPVVPENERVEVLAGLGCVDAVFLFDDPNVERILEELKPDVHAKGTDYTPETVPERLVVESYGGRVVISGDPKDHSSTARIAELEALKALESSDERDDGEEQVR